MKRNKKTHLAAPVPPPPKEYRLARYKCVVRIFENELQLCRISSKGERLFARGGEGWERVSHPVGQDFLDEVNGLMETRFTERDFQIATYRDQSRPPSFYLSRG